jgi:CIC family chloride channel protein
MAQPDSDEPGRSLNQFSFCLLAGVVGAIAGLGAVVFRALIALFHNLLFLGKVSASYNANIHTAPSPWGALVILVPVVGACVVAFLVKNFAPEAKGHGVPEVMDAIYYNKGRIRPVVAVVKSVASAVSIGSGGSVGREGPIIQIGSSFGSTVARVFRLPVWQRIALIAAGAGGGIAATFNTPVGGIVFAMEIMVHEVSARTLVPLAIATAMAAYIGRLVFGDYPSFMIPAFQTHYFHITRPLVLLSYVGLGLATGVASAVFIKSIYGFEDFFEKRVKGSYYTRHMLGMLIVGLTMYTLMRSFGHYYIEGVGYATIQDIMSGNLSILFLIALLFGLKLLATSLTLGSGASGGIFSPALFLGATLGSAYGIVLGWLFPGLALSPPAFAVAGMAGVVGGSTAAAVAAIVMIFEMTLDYNVIIPITITVAVSYGIRRILSRESIYTMKLVRRGHYMPEALQANIHFVRRAKEIMDPRFEKVAGTRSLADFAEDLRAHPDINTFLVVDDNQVIGFAFRDDALATPGRKPDAATVGDIAERRFVSVPEDTTLLNLIAGLRNSAARTVLVVRAGGGLAADSASGWIPRDRILDAVAESAEMFRG